MWNIVLDATVALLNSIDIFTALVEYAVFRGVGYTHTSKNTFYVVF